MLEFEKLCLVRKAIITAKRAGKYSGQVVPLFDWVVGLSLLFKITYLNRKYRPWSMHQRQRQVNRRVWLSDCNLIIWSVKISRKRIFPSQEWCAAMREMAGLWKNDKRLDLYCSLLSKVTELHTPRRCDGICRQSKKFTRVLSRKQPRNLRPNYDSK